MKIALATLIGIALGVTTNLVSDLLAPAVGQRAKLIISIFVGLAVLSLAVNLLPDSTVSPPNNNQKDGSSVESLRQDLARIERDLAEQKDINRQILMLVSSSQRVQETAADVADKQTAITAELAKLKETAKDDSTKENIHASQARMLTLTAKASDLKLSADFINKSREFLANQVQDMFTKISALPEGPERNEYLARIKNVQQADKTLELQLRRIDTQQQAVNAELNSVRRIIQRNIEDSFKTMG